MAVTFNPSITNYKPSFSGKQKAPTSSAHVNLATAADTVSIAAKPVVKNTLGHRLRNLAFGAMTLASTAFMGASCEKPIDPKPIIPTDTTINYMNKDVSESAYKMLTVSGVDGINYKSGNVPSEIVLYKELTDSYSILRFDNKASNPDSLPVYESTVKVDGTDTAKYYKIIKRSPSRLVVSEHVVLGNGALYHTGDNYGYALASDKKSVIYSWQTTPQLNIKKAAPNLIESSLIQTSGNIAHDRIHVIDIKFENYKNLKRVGDKAAQAAVDTINTISKNVVRTIR